VTALLDGLLDALGDLGPVPLHLVVAGLAFAETAMFLDFVVPGEAGMVLAGAAAHRAEVPLVGLVAAGAVGATLGDSCSYALGRFVGRRALDRWPRVKRRVEPSLQRAEQTLDRRGGAAVFFGRWVGALRAVVPFVAGAARMPYPRFLGWNVAASIAWVTAVVTVGYVFGETIASAVDRVGAVVSAVVVLGIVAWVLHRRRRRHAEGSDDDSVAPVKDLRP
jgi:membrane protein DedA with SNARE-associated domain